MADKLIENAWTEYRGWAARARDLQASSRRWTRIGLATVIVAAVCGTLAAQLERDPAAQGVLIALAVVAALASALYAWIGKEDVANKAEAGWTKARASAEAIKSECYLYAAAAQGYAIGDPDAATRFVDRLTGLKQDAVNAGVVPLDPGAAADRPAPDRPMPDTWYVTHRIADQIAFFDRDLQRSERTLGRLRLLGALSMLAAAACGATTALSANKALAGWIGVITTLVAALAAQGFAERYGLLRAKAGMMVNSLRDIRRRHDAGLLSAAKLVDTTEALMIAEHALWVNLMARTPAPNKLHAPAP